MADIARTDYKDDVLNTSQNTRRKYQITENSDGTISLEDVTIYSQQGDPLSATIINTIFQMLGGVTIAVTTQSAYDSMTTPRPANTLYLVPKE